MLKINRLPKLPAGVTALICFLLSTPTFGAVLFRAQGEMTGEVSSTSAIVQTRLTSVDRNVEGDVPGASGVVRFEYADNKRFQQSQFTAWNSAVDASDYIVKAVLRNLKSDKRYYYRVHYGTDRKNTAAGSEL